MYVNSSVFTLLSAFVFPSLKQIYGSSRGQSFSSVVLVYFKCGVNILRCILLL